MVLRMARPVARKGTVNPSFRKRIPADVKRVLDGLPDAYRPKGWGRDEIVISLGTADKRKGAAEYARVSAEVEQRFSDLLRGARSLTQRDAVALAGEVYRAFADTLEANPGSPETWAGVLDTNDLARHGEYGVASLMIGAEAKRAASMRDRFGSLASSFLAARGIVLDSPSHVRFVQALASALDDAARKLQRNAEGDYRPDAAAERFPAWTPNSPARVAEPKSRLALGDLFARWEKHPEQAGQARRTVARYKGVFAALSEFLANPEATKVTTDDVSRYLEARMAAEGSGRLTPRAARDVHKAAVSSIFGWAKGKGLVPLNPAEGIRIKVRKKPSLRPKEASDQEAWDLSRAALALPANATAGTMDAAQRWCPLVALYTGCRIGEVCQLRKADVIEENGLPMFRVTPEAGDVKDGEARRLPIHSRLVELGFIRFAQTAPDGPLFYGRRQQRKARANTPQYELVAADLATWGRANGLGDPLLLKPLHSLRHRFMTLARRAAIEEQYVAAITGHEPGNENRKYGAFPADVLHREIEKLRAAAVEGRSAATEDNRT